MVLSEALKTDGVINLMQGSIYQSAAAGKDTSTSHWEQFHFGHVAYRTPSMGPPPNNIKHTHSNFLALKSPK